MALDKEYIETLNAIKSQGKAPEFSLLYSNTHGREWASWTESPAEEFFVRSFPPLVKALKENQDKDYFQKLEILGWKFDKEQKEKANKLFLRSSSFLQSLPSDLSIVPGSIIDQFIQYYKEFFPEQIAQHDIAKQKMNYNLIGIYEPKEVLSLSIFTTSNPLYEFHSYDGLESPFSF